MQNVISTLVTAVCGAMIAVAAIIVMTNMGYMPVNGTAVRGYLLSNPQLVNEMAAASQAAEQDKVTKVQQAAIQKVGLNAFFDPKIAFVTGPANAANTVIEFYDYDCPYCRMSLPAVNKLYEQRKHDTRFAFIEMPIQQLHGESALMAARASVAVARNQPDKFLAFHTALMSREEQISEAMLFEDAAKAGLDIARLRADMARPEIAEAVNASYDFARKLNLEGTPTFIINGKIYAHAMDDAALAAAIKTR